MPVMADLTIGALAKRTGLTVRTLHHYDQIGLLSPSGRTDGGYRQYSDADILRLERIVLLRGLGMPLTDIAVALDSDANTIVSLVERQAADVQSRIDEATTLRARLDATIVQLRAHEYQTADDALAMIEGVHTFERYFDDEQRGALRERAAQLGPERIRQVEARWPQLIGEVRSEMTNGTPPNHPRVLALAEEWRSLLDEFTNGRWDIASSAGRMMKAEPAVQRRSGLDAEIMDYVAEAMGAL
jgi:MerR family transcriptional regulator, thiopeptide resistance regulator